MNRADNIRTGMDEGKSIQGILHIRKYLKAMTQLLENGLPVSYVMDAVEGPLVIKLGQG